MNPVMVVMTGVIAGTGHRAATVGMALRVQTAATAPRAQTVGMDRPVRIVVRPCAEGSQLPDAMRRRGQDVLIFR